MGGKREGKGKEKGRKREGKGKKKKWIGREGGNGRVKQKGRGIGSKGN